MRRGHTIFPAERRGRLKEFYNLFIRGDIRADHVPNGATIFNSDFLQVIDRRTLIVYCLRQSGERLDGISGRFVGCTLIFAVASGLSLSERASLLTIPEIGFCDLLIHLVGVRETLGPCSSLPLALLFLHQQSWSLKWHEFH
jgi:hypothetical protein